MFDSRFSWVGLPAGEADLASGWCDVDDVDDLALLTTVDEWNSGRVEVSRHVLPDLDAMVPGLFLMVVLELVDRSKLNGYDLVEVLKARERLVAHCQAAAQRDMVEISCAASGDAGSEPERLVEVFEYASDEIRAALTLTRRAADVRLDYATDLVTRFPQVLDLLDRGEIDWPKARVFVDGTCHLDVDEARRVVADLAGDALRLTTGQLRARIRKLCVEVDSEESVKRYQRAHEERRIWVEPVSEGTANLYLLDISSTGCTDDPEPDPPGISSPYPRGNGGGGPPNSCRRISLSTC